MKKLKKLLALALAVLMMLAVMPVAFAEETTEAETTTEAEATEDTGITAGDLFGGFFIKIGELLNTIFEFLSNLFSGSNGNAALDALK